MVGGAVHTSVPMRPEGRALCVGQYIVGSGRGKRFEPVDGIDREWLEAWADSAQAIDAAIPFEALNDLKRQDIPLLDVRDSL